MKKPCCLLVCGVLVCLWTARGYGEDKQPVKQSDFMRKKLEHSQKVLEGIAIGDFDKISRHASELLDLSKLAEWKVIASPRYELHSNDFRRSAQTLIDEAKAKNLDGCSGLRRSDPELRQCHKHVREVRMTRLDQPGQSQTNIALAD